MCTSVGFVTDCIEFCIAVAKDTAVVDVIRKGGQGGHEARQIRILIVRRAMLKARMWH